MDGATYIILSLQRAPENKNLTVRKAIMAGNTTDDVCSRVAALLVIGRTTVGLLLIGAMLTMGSFEFSRKIVPLLVGGDETFSRTIMLLLVGGDETGCCDGALVSCTVGVSDDISSCNIVDPHSSSDETFSGFVALLLVGGDETFSKLIMPSLVGDDDTGCCDGALVDCTVDDSDDRSSCNIVDTHSSNPVYSKGTFCRFKMKFNK
jgi:hypothetical protein